MVQKIIPLFLVLALLLSACSSPAAPTAAPTAVPNQPSADLSSIHSYLVKQSEQLHDSITQLKTAGNRYYELALAARFDYSALWAAKPGEVRDVIAEARQVFLTANPQYERMEGIVAGVPSLSRFDLILDAGTPGADGGESVVPFDLTLPDHRVLAKPGNLFEVTEATLWGTDPAYVVPDLHPDLNENGQTDLGDAMPDANVLKGAVDAFEKYAAELQTAAAAWTPTEAEAFGALVANVPTFSDFMESWKNSRFVLGDASSERGFVSTSRLSDLSDNILSWQTIYAGLSPKVRQENSDQDAQITNDLANLQKYVSDLYAQENKAGKRFTPEEADTLSAEGQNRATAIAGQISQAAARLGIQLESN